MTNASTLVTAPQRVGCLSRGVSKHFAEHTSLMRGMAENNQGPLSPYRHGGPGMWAQPVAARVLVGHVLIARLVFKKKKSIKLI